MLQFCELLLQLSMMAARMVSCAATYIYAYKIGPDIFPKSEWIVHKNILVSIQCHAGFVITAIQRYEPSPSAQFLFLVQRPFAFNNCWSFSVLFLLQEPGIRAFENFIYIPWFMYQYIIIRGRETADCKKIVSANN